MKSIIQSSSCRFRDSCAWISLLEAWFSQLLDFSLFWLGKAWQCLHGILHMWNYWSNFGFFHPFIWVQTNNSLSYSVFVGNDKGMPAQKETSWAGGQQTEEMVWKATHGKTESGGGKEMNNSTSARYCRWGKQNAGCDILLSSRLIFTKFLSPCWHCGHWDHWTPLPGMKLLGAGKDF